MRLLMKFARISHPMMVVAMLSAGGCITGTRHGYPLYPHPPLVDQQRVAFLSGYVHDVDGRDISKHGQSFDLLPGCHIVGTPPKSGMMDSQGGVVVTTGPNIFAIPMKAGYSYIIEVGLSGPFSETTKTGYLLGREIDGAGKTTRTFLPATTLQDVQACGTQASPHGPGDSDHGSGHQEPASHSEWSPTPFVNCAPS